MPTKLIQANTMQVIGDKEVPSKFIWRANLIVNLYKVLMFKRLDSYVLWWLRVLKSVYCMISFSRVLRETFEIQQMFESLSDIWHLTLHWFDFCFCFFVHFFCTQFQYESNMSRPVKRPTSYCFFLTNPKKFCTISN